MHRCLHHARTVHTISSLARSCASMLDVTPGLLVDNSWDHILINLSLLIHSWAHLWACMMDPFQKTCPLRE